MENNIILQSHQSAMASNLNAVRFLKDINNDYDLNFDQMQLEKLSSFAEESNKEKMMKNIKDTCLQFSQIQRKRLEKIIKKSYTSFIYYPLSDLKPSLRHANWD